MWLCFWSRSSVSCCSLSFSLVRRELSVVAIFHIVPSGKTGIINKKSTYWYDASSSNLPFCHLTSSRVQLCLQLVHSALQGFIDLHHMIGLFEAWLHSHLKLSFHLLTGATCQGRQERIWCLSLLAWMTTKEKKKASDLVYSLSHWLQKHFC